MRPGPAEPSIHQRASPDTPGRLPTGIPNLDLILGGGIPTGYVLLVLGEAGTGKTVLSFQTLFHAARAGQTALYVATIAEPTTKLIQHLRSFRFYREELVSKRLFLLNVYPLIRQRLEVVAEALIREVRARRATLVAIDGLMGIRDLHPESPELRAFIYDLGAALAVEECTTLITSSGLPPRENRHLPEFTMCDGILELAMVDHGAQTIRTIRATKMRGAHPLLGLHAMDISDEGITVYPRIEALARTSAVDRRSERVPMGLPELDQLMGGGPVAGTITLVAGAIGTGKTTLGLQFLLEGLRRGERCLYLGFRETPSQLVEKARALGLDLDPAIASGQLQILHRISAELIVNEITWRLRTALEQLRPERVVIDPISDLERATVYPNRSYSYLAALAHLLRSSGATTLVAQEVTQLAGTDVKLAGTPLAPLGDNLLLLRWVEYRSELYRILSVLKMANSAFDSSIHQLVIGRGGARVLQKLEAAEGLLSGIARLRGQSDSAPDSA